MGIVLVLHKQRNPRNPLHNNMSKLNNTDLCIRSWRIKACRRSMRKRRGRPKTCICACNLGFQGWRRNREAFSQVVSKLLQSEASSRWRTKGSFKTSEDFMEYQRTSEDTVCSSELHLVGTGPPVSQHQLRGPAESAQAPLRPRLETG